MFHFYRSNYKIQSLNISFLRKKYFLPIMSGASTNLDRHNNRFTFEVNFAVYFLFILMT